MCSILLLRHRLRPHHQRQQDPRRQARLRHLPAGAPLLRIGWRLHGPNPRRIRLCGSSKPRSKRTFRLLPPAERFSASTRCGRYPEHYESTDKKGFYDPDNIDVIDVDGTRCMELRVVSGKDRRNRQAVGRHTPATPPRAEERRLHDRRARSAARQDPAARTGRTFRAASSARCGSTAVRQPRSP